MNAKLGPSSRAGQDSSPPTRRVVDVVELLARPSAGPRTLAEICRELDISRSTGHAILATLCACDWARRDPLSGRFSLGSGFPRTPPDHTSASSALREPLRGLCSALRMAACVSEVRDGHIVVIESAAPEGGRSRVQAGQRLPFVAPFGREFVAWAPSAARQEWMAAAGPVNDVYRARMPEVLDEITRRGYGIERLSDPLLKVYAALLAVEDGSGPDPVAVRLAGAVADLTVVDFLPNELAQIDQCELATISAPIFDPDGDVALTVSAQPYRRLSPDEVRLVGDHVLAFAQRAGLLLSQSFSSHASVTGSP
ncbi:IclR family transcriptional regulator [Mycolicibacterium goodii]|uniref:IclR family transcriptional regulator n=1 Tax=Mycolicibacterium goodii TaxID=134601 RepID=UPI000C262DC8|nr:helix-turn-helix domain-containing protein [Mycolicibacterium goodii]PJK19767.1 IclR family transcriptional regulator [Mycolicibacterium goodii]